MANPIKVLLAGESWMTHSIHVKGFDSFEMSSYHEGGTELIAALRGSGVDVTYQPSHIAADQFPFRREELDAFDVVILSDIGTNTFLLPDRTAVRSEPTPNRRWQIDAISSLETGNCRSRSSIMTKSLPVPWYL